MLKNPSLPHRPWGRIDMAEMNPFLASRSCVRVTATDACWIALLSETTATVKLGRKLGSSAYCTVVRDCALCVNLILYQQEHRTALICS